MADEKKTKTKKDRVAIKKKEEVIKDSDLSNVKNKIRQMNSMCSKKP